MKKTVITKKKNNLIDFEDLKIIEEADGIHNVPEVGTKDIFNENFKLQKKFDKISSSLGVIIILVYLFCIMLSCCLSLFNLCLNCYPQSLEKFETLVLIIIGFFFGTRVIPQYLPIKK